MSAHTIECLRSGVTACTCRRARELDASGPRVEPACHGLRRKGTTAIIGVIPNHIAAMPPKQAEYLADYEEVPLYTHPPGFVLVPREPTREMMLAAARYQYGDDCVIDAALNADYVLDSLAATYRAMLAAAQENAP